MDLFKNQARTSLEEDSSQFAMKLVTASVLPMVFKSVLELGVLDIIGKAGPDAHLSSSEIASSLPTKNPEAPVMLERMLRLLSSHSVLTSTLRANENGKGQMVYGLTPVCKYFITNDDGASMAPFVYMVQDKVAIESWYHLKETVLDGGIPFSNAHGISATEYLKNDTPFGRIFKQCIREYNVIYMNKILDTYKGFEGLKVLVDVGGGDGSILNKIISNYPSVKGINFDLPQVIEKAPSYPGVEHVTGDMFASVPKGDAIFMKNILHCWSDEGFVKLMRNCYKALPDSGKVIAVDIIIPEFKEYADADACIFQFDSFLMTINPEGRERTQEEFGNLAKEAGFAGIRVPCSASSFSLMEFYKSM
ncbi:hypothetical protein Sjap_005771 [Stephania japonica]|uniref:Uncharacterized protein n=1 Tax=Stephania japonica TaxID=461633 RepID=A0AAP0PIA7_9MAGN|nr:COMT protein [Stephania japonica]